MNIHPDDYLILIVDDTVANIRLLSHVLKKEGYNVETATNGNEAIQATRKYLPDLILLDVMMPDKSGFQVSNELKESSQTAEIPIIFLSALSESDVKVKGFKSGGVDYITKPFKKEETLARINTHLYLRTLQNSLNERIRILKEREAQLSRLNKQKDDLVRMVSHDIKNPLTGILGLVKLIKADDKLDKEERKHMFSVIESSGNKLLRLVKEVLDKEDNRRHEESLKPEKANLKELAEQIVDLNKAKAIIKNIDLFVKTDLTDLEAVVDPSKLEIVINNLVSNALKFTPNKGEVVIEISEYDDNTLLVEVRDTGIGIPEKLKNDIFVSSQRNSTLGTNGEVGKGLGLDIVQRYVEMHNGTIWVESEIDKGTSFFIKLPLIKS
ncbi:MAG: hybrid sensor histidine kinase/response regulator [Balneolaceae bacterium]|nr:hybrid sensor histidine kinase/response regulator [Balneolaceae bacterium]